MIFESLKEDFIHNHVFFVRILLAVLCGAMIGLERSHRQKEAGIRTHVVLALGSAAAVIASKYGFLDTAGFDSARVAASIVTGVSFLGAGVIFVRGSFVKGLTTAAGLWTTACIGILIGCGLYTMGIFCTAVLVIMQLILHKIMPYADTLGTNEFVIKLNEEEVNLGDVLSQFPKDKFAVLKVNSTRNRKIVTYNITIKIGQGISTSDVIEKIINLNGVIDCTLNSQR